jgi:FkbM family methyltransferase
MESLITRTWTHVLEGTLGERLAMERRRRRKQVQRLFRRFRGRLWRLRGWVLPSWVARIPDAGVRLRLYRDSEFCRMIYCGGFEREELQFTGLYLRPGDIFVDLGAHIGLYTVLAAQRVGPPGRVYAFEPAAGAFQKLIENLVLNGLENVFPRRQALSDQEGLLELKVPGDGHDAWSSFGRPTAGVDWRTEIVKTISLDAFVWRNNLLGKIALIKMDVEGWESRILRGGRWVLSQPDGPALIVELNEAASRAAGSSTGEICRSLGEAGYRLFRYQVETQALVPFPGPAGKREGNVIALKEGTARSGRVVVQYENNERFSDSKSRVKPFVRPTYPQP